MTLSYRHTLRLVTCLLLTAVLSQGAAAQTSENHQFTVFSNTLSGSVFDYKVKRGDYITLISSRFGVPYRAILKENKLSYKSIIYPGQILRIDNRHIAPNGEPGKEIVINLPQRMLFHYSASELQASYPVALGKPTWPTPSGSFSIINQQENKPWFVPKSIQEEMRNEGRVVKTMVPPGPDNPLGKHWLGLSIPGYGIHGTISPESIFHFRSHGCIRLHPEDIEILFDTVSVGTQGEIIYSPVLLALLPDNKIFLEVHKDIYEKAVVSLEMVRTLAEAKKISTYIDWEKAKDIVTRREGVAREVTFNAAKQNSPSQK